MRAFYKKLFQLLHSRTKKQEGIALVVTLLVLMVLVLLALSIALQSQTEYVISVNEQDGVAALAYGESGLQWINREVINYVNSGFSPPPNLTDILNGFNNADSADDFLPHLNGLTLTTGVALNDLDESNEQTTSVIASLDWDGSGTAFGAQDFEAFRLGQSTDGDNVWDGPRAEVYIRLMDNYDDGSLNVTDTDNRMRALIVVDYPVFVDADGNKISKNVSPRGTGRRRLVGRFAPGGNVAIRTDGDLEINGNLEVCGECGGVHANETITIDGSVATCGEATGTTGIQALSAEAQIRGGAGLTGRVFIPVINPYDDLYVPPPTLFDTRADTTLPDALRCPQVSGAPLDTDTDPGATKYFAFVLRQVSGAKHFQVYKAYWDKANSHWVWRLIDDSSEADGLDTVLDNCGRVVSGTVRGVALQRDNPLSPTTGRTDGGVNEFYGFAPSGGQQGNWELQNPACDADETLAGVTRNDFNPNDYWRFPDGSNPFTAGDLVLQHPADYTRKSGTTATAADPLLPGNVKTYADVLATPNSNPVNDGQPDFEYPDAIKTGQGGGNRGEITNGNGQDVYSPLWGSVLFVYGNFTANGGSNLKYVNGSAQADMDLEDIVATGDGRWRVSFIVFNSLRFTGNPVWGTFGDAFPVTAVAGRDIEMGGTGQVPGSQDQCPSMALGSDCTADPPQAAGYAGMLLAHEEVHFTGNVQLDGFIIAEDAATCSPTQADESKATGSVQIHYDCVHPPNIWGEQASRLVSWEEVQVTDPDYD